MTLYDVPITLASASPRRLDLLRTIGLEPHVVPADVAEQSEAAHPVEAARTNARRKLEAVLPLVQHGIVLAADTVVIVDGRGLGKPGSDDEAREMIRTLSGREHAVVTGYSLAWIEGEKRATDHETTRVRMRTLHPWEIDRYVASGEPDDKAGAYGIQGRAAAFVQRVEGCYFNVVGLPVARIVETLNHWFE